MNVSTMEELSVQSVQGNVAESVCQFLNAAKEKNNIPSNPKSKEE